MTAYMDPQLFDGGLAAFHAAATTVWICSSQPTNFTQASSTYALGSNVWGAGSAVGAPATGSPSGRQVTVASVTAGNVTGNGTAAFYAVSDATYCYAANNMSSSQAVTAGNAFTLASFVITLRGAT